MMSVRTSLIYFLIFVIVASFAAYKITDTAYENAYAYDDYSYAMGVTNIPPKTEAGQ
ncbi:hypothetical protein K2Q02_02800 [Patescibacteria group bacterium]|nr:hypothetical protein [Patescibacteria group bacterium]